MLKTINYGKFIYICLPCVTDCILEKKSKQNLIDL